MSKKAKALAVGATVSTESLQFRAPAKRATIYDSIYSKLAELKKGQSFVVPVPKDIPVRTLQNRINAAIRRGPVDAPAGCVFRKQTTVKGEIAICCLGEEESLARDSRFADKAAKLAAKKAKKGKKSKAA